VYKDLQETLARKAFKEIEELAELQELQVAQEFKVRRAFKAKLVFRAFKALAYKDQ
jgi:hypothetical protein